MQNEKRWFPKEMDQVFKKLQSGKKKQCVHKSPKVREENGVDVSETQVKCHQSLDKRGYL